MNYRSLGRTGLVVSEIGFGAWGIGGRTVSQTSYGDTDDRTSLAALARAYDCGITFFDTSAAYGNGHSEELIGEALSDVRHEVGAGDQGGLRGVGPAAGLLGGGDRRVGRAKPGPAAHRLPRPPAAAQSSARRAVGAPMCARRWRASWQAARSGRGAPRARGRRTPSTPCGPAMCRSSRPTST